MNSDFIVSDCSSLPKNIDTLDDAIRYLQEARKVVGGDTKFRIVCEYDDISDSDQYRMVDDVMLKGSKSLMKRGNLNSDYQSFVLFVH